MMGDGKSPRSNRCKDMKAIVSLLALLISIQTLSATSVTVGEHQCPICERKLKKTVVMSFSQFGEPARDFSDSPQFSLFGDTLVCPWTLFASLESDWEIEDPVEKARLREFLKKSPKTIRLTKAEFALSQEVEVPGQIRNLLWARTCYDYRGVELDRSRFMALKLFYLTASDAPEENLWHGHYREEAIKVLAAEAKRDSLSEELRITFTYLKGELLRQAGRKDEARAALKKSKTMAEASESGEDDWLAKWAAEQLAIILVNETPSAELEDWLLKELWTSFKKASKKEEVSREDWEKHQLALETLVERAVADPVAENIHWKRVQRKSRRLVELAETTSTSSVSRLGEIKRWKDWFGEIAAAVAKGELPKELERTMDDEERKDLLGQVAGFGKQMIWETDRKVVAAVARACEVIHAGGEINGLDQFPIRDVLGQVLDLLGKENGDAPKGAVRLAIRLLKEQSEDLELANYPIPYLLRAMYERREAFASEIRKELAGEWKCRFWKECVNYVLGDREALKFLLSSPLLKKVSRENGRVFEKLLFTLFEKTKEPALKPRAIELLKGRDHLPYEVESYLAGMFDPEIEEVVLKRLKWIYSDEVRKLDNDLLNDLLEYEALEWEGVLADRKVQELEFAVMD